MSDETPRPYNLDSVIEYASIWYSATSPQFYARIGRYVDPDCLSNGPGGFEGKGEPRKAMEAVHEAVKRNGERGPTHIRITAQVVKDWCEDGRIIIDEQIRVIGWLLDTPGQLPPEEEVINSLVPLLKRRGEGQVVVSALETFQTRGDLGNMREMIDDVDRIGAEEVRIEGELNDAAFDDIAELRTVSRLPTPVIELNQLLGGGLPRGQYGLIAAESGVGKSTYLTSQICVGLRCGLRCALISNELGLAYQHARIFANLAGTPFNDVFEGRDTVTRERFGLLKEMGKVGVFKSVHMEEGHTVADCLRWLDEKEQIMGAPFDLVAVDYPDRMSGGRSADGSYLDQKHVTGGFRDAAEKRKYWIWGATQPQERDEVKIIKGRHLADSMWKKRLIHVGISANEREDGHTLVYHVFKNTTGISGVTTSPIPHDKHMSRIAPVEGDPWAQAS